MHTFVARMCNGLRQAIRGHLAPFAFDQGQFRAIGIEFRCAAFIFFDMGDAMAEDRLPRLHHHRQGQGIGGCARADEINRRLWGLEQVADGLAHACHGVICAIGHGIALIGRCNGRNHIWMGGACIVGGKVHNPGSSIM